MSSAAATVRRDAWDSACVDALTAHGLLPEEAWEKVANLRKRADTTTSPEMAAQAYLKELGWLHDADPFD